MGGNDSPGGIEEVDVFRRRAMESCIRRLFRTAREDADTKPWTAREDAGTKPRTARVDAETKPRTARVDADAKPCRLSRAVLNKV